MSLVAFLASGSEPMVKIAGSREYLSGEGHEGEEQEQQRGLSAGHGTPAERVAASLLVEALADPKGPFAVAAARSLAKIQASTAAGSACVAAPLACLATEALECCDRAAHASLQKFRTSCIEAAGVDHEEGEEGDHEEGGASSGNKGKGKKGRGRAGAGSDDDAGSRCEELEVDDEVARELVVLRGVVGARREAMQRVGAWAAGAVLGTLQGDACVHEDEEGEDEEIVCQAGLDLGASGLDQSRLEIEEGEDEGADEDGGKG